MKFKFLAFLGFLLLSSASFGQTNVYDSINFGGRWRTFLTHLPTGYEVTKKGKKKPFKGTVNGKAQPAPKNPQKVNDQR